MNCHCFQDKMFEYLDGELAASAQSEIGAHLEECADCRRTVQAHQALAAQFRRETDSLVFRPDLKRSVEASLFNVEQTSKSAVPQVSIPSAFFGSARVSPYLHGMKWLAAIAAVLLVAAVLSFRRPFHPSGQTAEAAPKQAPATISIHLTSCDPIYTFRREKNLVIDALTCAPRVVEETFSLSLNRKNNSRTQERKTSL